MHASRMYSMLSHYPSWLRGGLIASIANDRQQQPQRAANDSNSAKLGPLSNSNFSKV
jgi:hypothetical protein